MCYVCMCVGVYVCMYICMYVLTIVSKLLGRLGSNGVEVLRMRHQVFAIRCKNRRQFLNVVKVLKEVKY